jgi:ABC-type multidrug transport system ATPase subunit
MLAHLLALKGVRAKVGTKKLVAELLDRVNLTHAADRKVKTYSGGMRQRLGIAQAIAGDPRLVVVDEPTAGLDPEERLRFYHLLAELAEGRIVLLSTHIVEDVAVLCPRFAMIQKGRLVARTTPAEARATLEGTMYEGLLSKGELDGVRARHHVTQSLLFEGRHRVRIHVPGNAQLSDLPPGFAPARATLEDTYLVLTGAGRNAPERKIEAAALASRA